MHDGHTRCVVCNWFLGGPRHVIYRRVVRAEVLPNGVNRLRLGYLEEGHGDEEVFEGKTREEASHKLDSYLRHAHAYEVHYSNVDTLSDICAAAESQRKSAKPRQ